MVLSSKMHGHNYEAPHLGLAGRESHLKRRLVDQCVVLRWLFRLRVCAQSKKAIAKQQNDQPTAVSDHFTLPAHSIDNIKLVPLELITSNRDAIRKAREAFLISIGH